MQSSIVEILILFIMKALPASSNPPNLSIRTIYLKLSNALTFALLFFKVRYF
jgi:hypothetical protein